MFFVASGDEGAYHNQAVLLATGSIPVLDFYAQQGIWTYLPYAAVARWVSPQVEAVRLVSVFSIVAVTAMVTLIARRTHGRRIGALAFVLMGCSWPWVFNNIELKHFAPADFGLVAAYFFLYHVAPRRLWPALLAGFFLGIAINGRQVLVPMAIVFVCLALFLRPDGVGKGQARRRVLAATGGALVASLPSLYILAADPQAFLFDYLLARIDFTSHNAGGGAVAFLASRIQGWLAFFQGFGRAGLAWNLALLPALAAGLAANWRVPGTKALAALDVRASLWICLGIVACYSVADVESGNYILHVIPFLVIAGCATLARAAQAFSGRLPIWVGVPVARPGRCRWRPFSSSAASTSCAGPNRPGPGR